MPRVGRWPAEHQRPIRVWLQRPVAGPRLTGVAFDSQLAERVHERVLGTDGLAELKMFGGWGITIFGNMAVGVMGADLIVRVGPDRFADALARPGVRPFDFTGRAMSGWVYVAGPSVAHGRSLTTWVTLGVTYAQSLPPKSSRRPARPPSAGAPNRR